MNDSFRGRCSLRFMIDTADTRFPPLGSLIDDNTGTQKKGLVVQNTERFLQCVPSVVSAEMNANFINEVSEEEITNTLFQFGV